MNRSIRRIISFIVCCILGLSLFLTTLSVSAATTWPSISSSKVIKVFTISTSNNTPAYSDANLTKKKGTIYASDELWISKIEKNSKGVMVATCSYPITGSNSRKSAIIPLSAVTSASAPGKQGVAQASLTTYRRAGSSTKAGSISKNDKVWKLSVSGNYTQVMYNIGSSSAPTGYRIAWISTSNYNKYVKVSGESTSSGTGSTSVSKVDTNVQRRLDQIANGTLKYDSITTMTLNNKFNGTRANEQCKGFAKNVFYMCFNIVPGSTQNSPNNYLLNDTKDMYKVGSVTCMTQANIKSLFMKAKIGDFVQIRRKHTGSHSAIVYSVSNNGVTFFEANTDGKNTVKKLYYTWADLCSKNAAMSVYSASNYKLK